MATNLSDKFKLNITMYDDFETNRPVWNPMQGRVDTDFYISLSKDGEIINIDQHCVATAKFFLLRNG